MRKIVCLALALVLARSAVARAEPDRPGSRDSPLLSRLPHTHITQFEERDFDEHDFAQAKGPRIHVEGSKLHVEYALDKGAEKLSPLEILRNDENALRAAGWTIARAGDAELTASLVKGGREVWIEVNGVGWGGESVTIVDKAPLPMIIEANKPTTPPAGAPPDAAGGKDYPGIPRLPGQRLSSYKESRFDSFAFPMASGPQHRVEGKKIVIDYTMVKGAKVPSLLQARQNYLAVLAAEGWVPVAASSGSVTALLRDKSHETWALIHYNNGWGSETVTVVEQGEMKQQVTASALLDQLNREGHVAFEVHFDTGADAIKPESKPVIAQMVALLQQSPTLKVEVQGHTDNVGNDKDNQALSERRAKSVMQALVAGGIDAARLTARGYGPSKPIADSASEGGRAMNRRVELAKK